MTLENIYYIGQTVAVLAILVSLIFLAICAKLSVMSENGQHCPSKPVSLSLWK